MVWPPCLKGYTSATGTVRDFRVSGFQQAPCATRLEYDKIGTAVPLYCRTSVLLKWQGTVDTARRRENLIPGS